MSSGHASNNISAISNQWYGKYPAGASAVEEGKKGGEIESVVEGRTVTGYGCGGGGEKVSGEISVSYFRICSRDCGRSQGGGRMFARCWRLRRSASQRGRVDL